MKKLLGLLVFTLFFVGLVSAADSPLYAKVVPIQKVTSHQKGYKVTYFTNKYDVKAVYVPIEWFYQVGDYRTADGFIKAEVVRGQGSSYPYMQIFWKDGKFHHLRLFVVDNYNDPTWGVVQISDALDTKFDPAKTLDFQF